MLPSFPFVGSSEGITRLWLTYPDRTLATLVDRFVDFEMDLEALLSGTIQVKVPLDHRMFGLDWNGVGILDRDLENWGCKFFYRDPGNATHKVFSGIANPVKLSHRGQRGNAYVEIEFDHIFWEIMRRRNVWTEFGGRWEYEGSPDNIVRQLVLTNFCDGDVVTPIGNTTDRTRLGPEEAPWTVIGEAVKPVGDHPETMKYIVDHGTKMNECLRELFEGRMPNSGNPTDIYPSFEEGAPGEFHFAVLCGKDFVLPREIGRDLTGTSVEMDVVGGQLLAPERRNIMSWSRGRDRTDQYTSLQITGALEGPDQLRTYIDDPEMVKRVGVIENTWNNPNALEDEEMMFEARTYLAKRREGTTAVDVELIEWPGRFVYPDQINLMDTVAVYSGRQTFDQLQMLDVVKVNVKIPVPGYPKVSIGLGQLERNWLSEANRHGGGGGGGGGSGGRPRNKNGNKPGTCTAAIACIQDEASETCVEECGGKVKFLGDAWIDVKETAPDPQDPGPGETDIVVRLKWCAPLCDLPNVAGGVIGYAQLCVYGPGGVQQIIAVPGYACINPAPDPGGPPPPAPGP